MEDRLALSAIVSKRTELQALLAEAERMSPREVELLTAFLRRLQQSRELEGDTK